MHKWESLQAFNPNTRQIWGGKAGYKASYREGPGTTTKSLGAVAVLVCLSLRAGLSLVDQKSTVA